VEREKVEKKERIKTATDAAERELTALKRSYVDSDFMPRLPTEGKGSGLDSGLYLW
jgi:hypothetical protein